MPIVLVEQTQASVSTPASGKAAIFVDSSDSVPKYKDDAGAVSLFVTASALQGTGLVDSTVGFRNIPQNAQTGNYTAVAADSGKHIHHASGAGSGDTYTIPANASVAYPLGTCLTFTNLSADGVSIAITSDTMYLADTGTTGTRTLAQYGVATALKVESTVWIISGSGLT